MRLKFIVQNKRGFKLGTSYSNEEMAYKKHEHIYFFSAYDFAVSWVKESISSNASGVSK